MSPGVVVAIVISLFFVLGAVVGVIAVVALSASREVRIRYKGNEKSLDPDDPDDAEKIVRRWLATQDNMTDGGSE
jgi:hypothetical protein